MTAGSTVMDIHEFMSALNMGIKQFMADLIYLHVLYYAVLENV